MLSRPMMSPLRAGWPRCPAIHSVTLRTVCRQVGGQVQLGLLPTAIQADAATDEPPAFDGDSMGRQQVELVLDVPVQFFDDVLKRDHPRDPAPGVAHQGDVRSAHQAFQGIGNRQIVGQLRHAPHDGSKRRIVRALTQFGDQILEVHITDDGLRVARPLGHREAVVHVAVGESQAISDRHIKRKDADVFRI